VQTRTIVGNLLLYETTTGNVTQADRYLISCLDSAIPSTGVGAITPMAIMPPTVYNHLIKNNSSNQNFVIPILHTAATTDYGQIATLNIEGVNIQNLGSYVDVIMPWAGNSSLLPAVYGTTYDNYNGNTGWSNSVWFTVLGGQAVLITSRNNQLGARSFAYELAQIQALATAFYTGTYTGISYSTAVAGTTAASTTLTASPSLSAYVP
jgi:hypothetical protein